MLIGFGVNADENGNTIGLKLSMFDVFESDDLTEKHEFEINNQKVGKTHIQLLYQKEKLCIFQVKKI